MESKLYEIFGEYYRVRELGSGRFEAEDSFKAVGQKEAFKTLRFKADFLEDGTVTLSERSGRFSRNPEFMCAVIGAFRPEFRFMTAIGQKECSIVFSFDKAGPSRTFKDMLR